MVQRQLQLTDVRLQLLLDPGEVAFSLQLSLQASLQAKRYCILVNKNIQYEKSDRLNRLY